MSEFYKTADGLVLFFLYLRGCMMPFAIGFKWLAILHHIIRSNGVLARLDVYVRP